MLFQSTHPVRGATWAPQVPVPKGEISIHAPREGCDLACGNMAGQYLVISIHAPREGCDSYTPVDFDSIDDFNPRTP